jgi:hypothetical protein
VDCTRIRGAGKDACQQVLPWHGPRERLHGREKSGPNGWRRLKDELAAVTRDLVEWSVCRATQRGPAHLYTCSGKGGGACIGLPRLSPTLPTVDVVVERAAGQRRRGEFVRGEAANVMCGRDGGFVTTGKHPHVSYPGCALPVEKAKSD